ncbi:hypothetical protein DT23_14885 [Thioclava indica]|uniref:Uncharacterized protein n=1 Tax=Thioclava indica TaxID=1353528 RepID=A0A074KEL3_9RHOB|nr:hypothetical protein DT23_14885 [Thioclava indica]
MFESLVMRRVIGLVGDHAQMGMALRQASTATGWNVSL